MTTPFNIDKYMKLPEPQRIFLFPSQYDDTIVDFRTRYSSGATTILHLSNNFNHLKWTVKMDTTISDLISEIKRVKFFDTTFGISKENATKVMVFAILVYFYGQPNGATTPELVELMVNAAISLSHLLTAHTLTFNGKTYLSFADWVTGTAFQYGNKNQRDRIVTAVIKGNRVSCRYVIRKYGASLRKRGDHRTLRALTFRNIDYMMVLLQTLASMRREEDMDIIMAALYGHGPLWCILNGSSVELENEITPLNDIPSDQLVEVLDDIEAPDSVNSKKEALDSGSTENVSNNTPAFARIKPIPPSPRNFDKKPAGSQLHQSLIVKEEEDTDDEEEKNKEEEQLKQEEVKESDVSNPNLSKSIDSAADEKEVVDDDDDDDDDDYDYEGDAEEEEEMENQYVKPVIDDDKKSYEEKESELAERIENSVGVKRMVAVLELKALISQQAATTVQLSKSDGLIDSLRTAWSLKENPSKEKYPTENEPVIYFTDPVSGEISRINDISGSHPLLRSSVQTLSKSLQVPLITKSLDELPPEIMVHIMMYLNMAQILNLRLCCKSFYLLFGSNALRYSFWKHSRGNTKLEFDPMLPYINPASHNIISRMAYHSLFWVPSHEIEYVLDRSYHPKLGAPPLKSVIRAFSLMKCKSYNPLFWDSLYPPRNFKRELVHKAVNRLARLKSEGSPLFKNTCFRLENYMLNKQDFTIEVLVCCEVPNLAFCIRSLYPRRGYIDLTVQEALLNLTKLAPPAFLRLNFLVQLWNNNAYLCVKFIRKMDKEMLLGFDVLEFLKEYPQAYDHMSIIQRAKFKTRTSFLRIGGSGSRTQWGQTITPLEVSGDIPIEREDPPNPAL